MPFGPVDLRIEGRSRGTNGGRFASNPLPGLTRHFTRPQRLAALLAECRAFIILMLAFRTFHMTSNQNEQFSLTTENTENTENSKNCINFFISVFSVFSVVQEFEKDFSGGPSGRVKYKSVKWQMVTQPSAMTTRSPKSLYV
jgi:hypothetical protein